MSGHNYRDYEKENGSTQHKLGRAHACLILLPCQGLDLDRGALEDLIPRLRHHCAGKIRLKSFCHMDCDRVALERSESSRGREPCMCMPWHDIAANA